VHPAIVNSQHPAARIARRALSALSTHEVTTERVITHGAYSLEAISVGAVDALTKHYLGDGDAWEVYGVPVVGATGLLLAGFSILGGSKPWAGHANNMGNCALACGTSDWLGAMLKAAGK
jgi:hypothetical protein